MHTFKRRDFLKTMGAGTAGTLLVNFGQFGCNRNMSVYSAPGNLTTFAILNDVAMIALAGSLVPENIRSLIHTDLNLSLPANLSLMGHLVPGNEQQVTAVLQKAHEELSRLKQAATEENDLAKETDQAARKSALMLGWFMAAGIRENLHPLWKEKTTAEMQVYQDMVVLKAIAGKSPGPQVQKVESLFNEMVPRMIARTHTLTPDYDDGPAWTIRISRWREENRELMKAYANAYVNPAPDKTAQYVTMQNFYSPDDPVIQAAREKKSLSRATIDGLNPGSLYGKAVLDGVRGLIKASLSLQS